MLRKASQQDDDDARRLLDQLKALQTSVNAIERSRDGPVIITLRGTMDDSNFDIWHTAAKALIDACIKTVDLQRDESIRNASIDSARLLHIATAASSMGFAKDSGAFPLGHISDVRFTNESLEPFILSKDNQARGELTTPLMAQPVSNEESWWAETMRDYVGAVVLESFISSAPVEDKHADTPEAWWEAVSSAAELIELAGSKPMVIVASLVDPIWLNDWTWNVPNQGRPPRPHNLKVWRSDSDLGPSYELHLNDIPVFRGHIEPTCSYVIPESLFNRVEFTKYPSGQTVLIEVQDHPSNDPWKTILKATFARRVTIGNGKILRIRF